MPIDYGDPAAELEALRRGCGVFDLAARELLDIGGEDRARFLNGLVTVSVRTLAAGQGVYGFLTEQKGRLLSDVVVSCETGRLRLELPSGRGATIANHLQRYQVADRVTVEGPLERGLLLLLGPRLADILPGLTIPFPEAAFGHAQVELGRGSVRVRSEPRPRVPAIVLESDLATLEAVAEEVVAAGVVPVGWQALDALRIDAGWPLWGKDFDDGCLPQETALESAVDYTKGCYLGQEVVARLHYRGQAPRVLRRLHAGVGGRLREGAEVVFDGRAAGIITTAEASTADANTAEALGAAHPRAFAMLQRRAAEPGTVVLVEGDRAMVEALSAHPAG